MENQKHVQNSFAQGIRDGIPIGLGYLSVSFTFGMLAVAKGLPVWAAVAISMTNLTSAGQFAGLDIILASASYFEMALTQLIINMRYALMSVSMSLPLLKTRIPNRGLSSQSDSSGPIPANVSTFEL